MSKKSTSPKIIAHRYAYALYHLAAENKAVAAILKDLTNFAISLEKMPLALTVFGDHKTDLTQKQAAMDALIKKGKPHTLSANFFKVLINQHRFGLFFEIVEQFKIVHDDHQNIRHVTAVTATKLNKKQQDLLEDNLKAALGASAIDLEAEVNPDVLGGILIRFGSTLVDDTIKNKLNRIGQNMKGIA